MSAARPVRLELNNSGSWKLLGRFDASDSAHCDRVMYAAEQLVRALNNDAPPQKCASLRISIDDSLAQVLMRWDAQRDTWYDAKAGGLR